jgi:hypothetical protein
MAANERNNLLLRALSISWAVKVVVGGGGGGGGGGADGGSGGYIEHT